MIAKKIWINKTGKDVYADFIGSFDLINDKNIKLRICADNIVTVWINGKIGGFASFADYPGDDEYKEFDITKYCKSKENEIKITVWHFGEDSQVYIKDDPFLMFEIIQGEDVLLTSDENILSRLNPNYKNGYCKKITGQLGFSFLYDSTIKDKKEYTKSIVINEGKAKLSSFKNLVLMDRENPKITCKNGVYTVDMGREMAGFVELDFVTKKEQEILFSFGEHLKDGRVRRIIGNRDFSFEYIARKGENKYINTFRRFAGRYLEFKAEDIDINFIGIRDTIYPVTFKKIEYKDELIKKINDISIRTLHLCMHEHFEDCPWREQGLYNMDGRNEMLVSYYAFEGSDFQRANLVLISKGLRKDGLLSLCFPAGSDVPIPSFSLAYPISVYEYIEHTKDYTILDEVGDTIKTIMETFKNRIEENSLIRNFPYPYWNFYEWTKDSNNEWQIGRKQEDQSIEPYDLILNCFYVYSMSFYDKLFNEKNDLSKIKEAIKKTFYLEEKGVYKLSTNKDSYSQLGNSLAVLIGMGDEKLVKKIIEDKDMIGISLSMNIFLYDALLKTDKKYGEYIIDRIKNIYKKMIDKGATSFWETEKGEADFDGAGSLCHGWSALPVYYFNKLVKE